MSGDYVIGNGTSTEAYEKLCYRPDDLSADLVKLAFSAATVPLHLFVVIAMIFHANVIKRNVVNIYAGNVVFSSLVSSAWMLFVASSIAAKRKTGVKYREYDEKMDTWETAKVAFEFQLVLVTAGSIGLLINAMRSIQFRVHRTVGGVANQATDTTCERKEKCSKVDKFRTSHKHHPKSWALFYITMVWLIPILITVFTSQLDACIYNCHCKYFYEPVGGEPNCEDLSEEACSNLMPPLSRASLAAGVALWMIYVVLLTASLAKTFHDLKKLTKKRCDSIRTNMEEKKNELGSADKDLEKSVGSHDEMAQIMYESGDHGDGEEMMDSDRKQSETRRSVAVKFNNDKACKKMSGSIFIKSLRKNFHLLLFMFIAYMCGSIPMLIVGILDAAGIIEDDFSDPEAQSNYVTLDILPLVSQAACTIAVCVYLSGVKSAVRNLLVKLPRCC